MGSPGAPYERDDSPPERFPTIKDRSNSPGSSQDRDHSWRLEHGRSSVEMSPLQQDREYGEEDEEAGQSPQDKMLPRRRHTLSNGQEVDEDLYIKTLGNAAFTRNLMVNGTLIGLWYLFSVSISVYNKWMFADGQLDFHFPLFTTSMHMIVQFTLASLVLYFFPSLRPRHDALDAPRPAGAEPPPPSSKPLVPLWFYVSRIAPCAAATGLDIGLGNTSLIYVTLIFFTMCKSSTLGFVLLFAILFRLEKPSLKLAGIIAVMTVGVIMMVAGETAFNAVGFALLMTASLFSGLRWSLTQMLLRRNPATSNPFASLFFLTPIMFVTLFVIAVPVEGFGPVQVGFDELVAKKGFWFSIFLLIFPGVLAFMMTSAEFALLKRTSVVTLSVCGIFKEVITIAAGGIIFDESLTPINISGLMVTIAAIGGYNWIRMKKMKKKAIKDAQDEVGEHAPMLSTEPGPDDRGREVPVRNSTGEMIRRSLSLSTSLPARVTAKETGSRSPLVKLPENVQ